MDGVDIMFWLLYGVIMWVCRNVISTTLIFDGEFIPAIKDGDEWGMVYGIAIPTLHLLLELYLYILDGWVISRHDQHELYRYIQMVSENRGIPKSSIGVGLFIKSTIQILGIPILGNLHILSSSSSCTYMTE